MSIEFPRGERIEPIRGIENRDGQNHFLTRSNEAWMRAARYLELYESGKLGQLLAELDTNTTDAAIHPQAVALVLVRLAAATMMVAGGRKASRIALAFAQTPNTSLEIHEARDRLFIPR